MSARVGWARRPYVVALGLFVLVIALRLPFATTHLWAWDSVLYARALEQGFHVTPDPMTARPHPPGYIGYVVLATLVREVLGDSNAALVLLSIVAGAATTALLFLVAVRYVRPSLAAIAALAFAMSPVTWLYSEVAYPYTVLALISTLLGALFLSRRAPLVACLAFGVLSGFRQDVLLLLGPLWLWSMRPWSVRSLALRGALVTFGTLVWLVPSAALSGGVLPYASSLTHQLEIVAGTYSVPANGIPAFLYNAGFTAEAILWGMGLLTVPLAVALWRAIRRRHVPARDPLAAALALWVAPALLFYTVVHIGEWGYVLSVLPAFLLGAVIVLERAMPRAPSLRWAIAAAASVLLPATMFLAGDDAYQAVVGNAAFSAAALARHDAATAAQFAYVRERFPRTSTIIVTREDDLLVRYYLPEYRTYYWDPDPYRSEAKKRRMMRPTNVVVLTPGLQPHLAGDVRKVEIAPGVSLSYFVLDRGFVLELTGERYSVRDQTAPY